MKFAVLLTIVIVGLVACLPNVSTELPEPEARAILQTEVRDICEDRSHTILANVLGAVEVAQAIPERDNWIFKVSLPGPNSEYEALVFPSGRVSGNLILQLETRVCK